MLKKISRKTFLQEYPEFIQANNYKNIYIGPEVYQSYILQVEAKSTVGLCNKLSKEITHLLKLLQFETINFLGDTTSPWRYRNHDYNPVKKALNYLVENEISKSFNGALQMPIEGLPEFMKQLFWLVRCNGIVFYVYFSDTDFNIIGSICQYGNIHLSTLNEKTDINFNSLLAETNFSLLIDGQCGNKRITGREVITY